jgi:hypothetical protein
VHLHLAFSRNFWMIQELNSNVRIEFSARSRSGSEQRMYVANFSDLQSTLRLHLHSSSRKSRTDRAMATENSQFQHNNLLHMTNTSELEQQRTRIRSNFFNKLGIDEKKGDSKSINAPLPSRGSLLGNVQITQEPLKFDEVKEQPKSPWAHIFGSASTSTTPLSTSPSCSSLCSSSTGKREVRITFHSEVMVVPIPKREEYSKRVRDRLWSNPEELQVNAQRNSMEFAAEGWDWRTALEDENMYRDALTGELIHPIHCMHLEES